MAKARTAVPAVNGCKNNFFLSFGKRKLQINVTKMTVLPYNTKKAASNFVQSQKMPCFAC
jgi:hypothetical protein